MDKADFYLSEQEREELVALTQRLVQFPTEDPPGYEIEMARFLHETLQGWGFSSVLDEFEPGRANVVARVKGDGSRAGLVFSAHFDTMTIGTGAWRYPPFAGEIHEGKLFGRGASDMKSGMAAMLMAARRVAQWEGSLKGDLILAWSAGESSNCLGAKRMLETNALAGAGAIIVSEPSSLKILVAETGTWWVKASATGIPGHSSGATGGQGLGSNAILKLVDFINDLRNFSLQADPHPLLGLPTISIGTISGGTAVNQTPDYAELGIDIRFLPGMETQEMLAALQKLAGANISFETIDWKPPVEIASDHPLVEVTMDACRWRLGPSTSSGTDIPAPSGVAYYSDAVIFSPALGIPRVILGPGELGMSGQRDEYVELDKLIAAAEIYQHIAYDLLIARR